MSDGLHTTAELVEHYVAATDIDRAILEHAIPEAIDAVYRERDEDGTMHSAGAAAAVAALQAEAKVLTGVAGSE